MDRLTERDEFGNTDIIGVDSMDLQCNLEFDEFNKVTNALNKLAEYEDLEEQNRLLKLPCAVGDTVYYRYDGIKIAPMYMEKIIITKYGVNLLLAYCGNDEELKYWTIDIESTAIDCGIVFLTREEAEAALKELERGKG